MALLKLLINLLIFVIPFGVILRIVPVSNVAIYPQDIIVGLIFLIVAFNVYKKRKYFFKNKILLFLLLFVFTGFVSLLLSLSWLSETEFLIAVSYLLRFIAYSSILFAFYFLEEDYKKTIPLKLLIGGLIFTLIGFIQYFFYENLSNLYYLGWDMHLYRLFSTFLDPNFAGAFLTLCFLLALDRVISVKKNSLVIFDFFCLFSFTVAILLTYSRSAFIMLLVGTIILLFLRKKVKIMVGILVFLIIAFFSLANTKIEGLNPWRIASVDARFESMNEALKVIVKNPILGVGFNSYRYAQVKMGMKDSLRTKISNADAGTDNSFLFVIATTGIIGFSFFILYWLNILKELKNRFGNYSYAEIAFVSSIALGFNALFINSLFFPAVLFWVYMLCAITVSRKL